MEILCVLVCAKMPLVQQLVLLWRKGWVGGGDRDCDGGGDCDCHCMAKALDKAESLR